MLGLISKIFGGNKSEKDVKKITPQVGKINEFVNQYLSLDNDALRTKTQEFRQRIHQHLAAIDEQIAAKKTAADDLPVEAINEKDVISQPALRIFKLLAFTISPSLFVTCGS